MFMGSSLDDLGIDLVVLAMGADEPDIDHAVGVVDPSDESVFVSRDIEDCAPVHEDAGVP